MHAVYRLTAGGGHPGARQMCPTCCGNAEKQGIAQAGEAEKCLHRRSEIKLSEDVKLNSGNV